MDRYSDIKAYKHSRPILVPRASMPSGDPLVNSYINANFVDGPVGPVGDRKIIACQGPLDNTFQDIWRMIAQENVTLIVTTCNLEEKGRSKCHQFWPPVHGNQALAWEAAMRSVNITVEPSGEPILLTPFLILRKFSLTDSDLGIGAREVR